MSTKTTKPAQDAAPSLSPELAELAAIAQAQDAAIDGAQIVPGAATAEPAEPEKDRAAELAAMLGMGVAMAAPMLPFLPACYTPEVCAQIGVALDAVATKYGWNLDGLSSPELALATVSIPPTVLAFVLARQHFAAKRQADEAAKQAADKARTIDAPTGGQGFSSHSGKVLQPTAVN